MLAKFRVGQIARTEKTNRPVRVVDVASVQDGYSSRAMYEVKDLLTKEVGCAYSRDLKKVSKQSVAATIGNIRRYR